LGVEQQLRQDYDAVRDKLGPRYLHALCTRLLRGGDLPVAEARQRAELICLALAEGVLNLDDQVSRFLEAQGIAGPNDQTLLPAPITWTQRGVLSSPLTLSLGSPVIHAFLVQQGEQVNQVLVVGRGVGEARRRLYDAAFLAALASPRPGRELEAHEITRLEEVVEQAEKEGEVDKTAMLKRCIEVLRGSEPAEVLDGLIYLSRHAVNPYTGNLLPVSDSRDYMQDPFTLLVQELRQLAQTSSLVQLHTLGPDQVQAVRPTLEAKVFHDQAGRDPDRSPVACVVPVYDTIGDLTFTLPPRVLDTNEFRRLERTMLQYRAERTKADARDRHDFHRRHREQDQDALNEYQALSPEQRAERNKETFQLTLRVDHELGVEYTLKKPHERSGEWHYKINLPSLIKEATAWMERMERIYGQVEAAEQDGRLRRLAVGYALDRALRGLGPLPGDPDWPEMADWQQRVRPLLLHAWKEALEQAGASPASRYATRRLCFFTTFRGGRALVRPHYLFLNTTSVLDGRGPVGRLVDRIDHLDQKAVKVVPGPSQEGAGPAPEQQRLERRREEVESRLELALGDEQKTLGTEALADALATALRYDPAAATRRLCEYFLHRRPEALPEVAGADPWLGGQALAIVQGLLDIGAWHGALRHLVNFLNGVAKGHPAFQLKPNQLPEVPCSFLVLCGLVDHDPAEAWELVKRWWDDYRHKRHLPDHVRGAIALAEGWEPGYLARCLAAGGRAAGKGQVLQSKHRKEAGRADPTAAALPSLLDESDDLLRAAVALQQARNFPRQRTSARRMYRLLGDALARVMASTRGAAVDTQVQELSSLLLGAEHYLDENKPQFGEKGGMAL
jgi:hypothetical protein